MPRLSAPSRRDCPPGSSPAARSRRGCFPSLHRRIAAVPAAARLPLCPISMRHRHPLEFRKGRSTAKRHIRTITCTGPWVVRGRLTRDDASYRESERGVGDARSASLKAHGRWLADGPGRTMTGGRFGGAALRPGANVAVAEGGRTDAAGPSRQARTQGPGVCSAARPRARLHVWNARLHVGIRGLAWRRPQKRRPRSAMRFAPPHPRTHHFGPGLRGHSRTPARSSRSEARHVRMAGRPRRR